MINLDELNKYFCCDIVDITEDQKDIILSLVNIIHDLELDWWTTGINGEFARFGRKESGDERAKFQLGSIYFPIKNNNEFRISIAVSNSQPKGKFASKRIPGITWLRKANLTRDCAERIEQELSETKNKWPLRLALKDKGEGYWPNECYQSTRISDLSLTPEEVNIFNEIENDDTLDKTQKYMVIQSRIGQGEFRSKVLARAGRKCEITGVTDEGMLIASHIHAWAKCSTSKQRLDGNNGLLLSPSLDKLFDKGYISFNDEGMMLVKKGNKDLLRTLVPQVFTGSNSLRKKPSAEQCHYLELHRSENSFTKPNYYEVR